MELLEKLVAIFMQSGYLAVFMALMICGMGLPLPEDVVLIAGGVIAGLGLANVHLMFALCMFGVLLGDSTLFLLGHHYGTRIMRWRFVASIITPGRYALVQKQFHSYGNRVLFFARFMPGMRAAIYAIAGATHRVSILRFLLIDAAAALISVPVWVYLGFVGADNHQWLTTWIQRGRHGVWLLVIVLALVILALWWRHHHRKTHRR